MCQKKKEAHDERHRESDITSLLIRHRAMRCAATNSIEVRTVYARGKETAKAKAKGAVWARAGSCRRGKPRQGARGKGHGQRRGTGKAGRQWLPQLPRAQCRPARGVWCCFHRHPIAAACRCSSLADEVAFVSTSAEFLPCCGIRERAC